MEKERKLKIGVIGCGAISVRRHLPEYAANENVEIAALYNRTRSKAEDMQKKYGGIVCGSVEEMVAMDLDAVSVCTANAMHAHDTILALQAGKHVLCEKPMDVTIEKCTAMVEEARKAGKLLMIAQNQRFSSAHKKAHDLIAEGQSERCCPLRPSSATPDRSDGPARKTRGSSGRTQPAWERWRIWVSTRQTLRTI